MTAESDILDVTIIGGGFSGLMTLYHLVKTCGSGSHFAIIDPEENLGYGLAYRTVNPRHLLNVPAGNMSALPDEPDHFIKWLQSGAGHKASTAIGIGRTWHAVDYAPRCLYARYLGEIRQKTLQEAEVKGVRLNHFRQKAMDIERSPSDGLYRLELDNGQFLQSKAIVLATGNMSADDTNKKVSGLISDPWRYDHASMHNESGPVGIIGTGLTMVDTMLSLREAGFTGKILVVSRRGLLPKVHNDTSAAYNAALSLPDHAPEKLVLLMQALRGEAKSCLSKKITWQHAFDRWKPHVTVLWRKLDTNDRNRFLRRLFTLWNVHRHRMAPEIGALIDNELATGKLEILKGGVKVAPKQDGFTLTVRDKQHNAKKIFDCRGVCHDISLSGNKLISALHRKGLIQKHETGWGIKTAGDLRVLPLGRDGSFLAIGPLLIGEYLETTAVPELRQQAQEAAFVLHHSIRANKHQ
jgi:uncharacterized NAD(P)/FAD-binding protein YdhS